MVGHLADRALQQSLNVLAVKRVMQVQEVSAQLVFLFDQVDFVSLVGNLQR